MISMKKLFIVLGVIFFAAACKKDVSELPPATQTGADTFGAKVDGELWVPSGFGIIPTADILDAHFAPGKDLYINARNFSRSPVETEFEFFIKGVNAPGTYTLNQSKSGNTNSYAYYVKRNVTPLNEWSTNASYTGTVNISQVDTVNRFVSGTFAFTAINAYNTPQVLTVTEGRFDVKYQ